MKAAMAETEKAGNCCWLLGSEDRCAASYEEER